MGLKLFDAREHEQALIEFSKANEIKPRPAALFMMAQCEYLMGRLKDASAHYQSYATENPDGEFAELARDRVESIGKRPSTFVVNSVPEDVAVRISPEGETASVVASGQAPNNFPIPRGRYRIDVTKPNYQGQTRIVDIDPRRDQAAVLQAGPDPGAPGDRDAPPSATLYVNGNRARNPYRQDIAPGHIEIFAEATDYDDRDRRPDAGARRAQAADRRRAAPAHYVQRSGRPELLFASWLIGGLRGRGRGRRGIGEDLESPNVASVLLVTGGGIAGAVAGTLVGRRSSPATSPTTRRSSSSGPSGSAPAEGMVGGFVVRQVTTTTVRRARPSPRWRSLPSADRRSAAVGVRRQLARPRDRPDGWRADREAGAHLRAGGADPERRAGWAGRRSLAQVDGELEAVRCIWEYTVPRAKRCERRNERPALSAMVLAQRRRTMAPNLTTVPSPGRRASSTSRRAR